MENINWEIEIHDLYEFVGENVSNMDEDDYFFETTKVINKNKNILDFHNITNSILYTNIIKKNIKMFAYLKQEYQTDELIKYVISNDTLMFRYVKDELKTKELCDFVFNIGNKNGYFVLRYIPKHFITNDMYQKAFLFNKLIIEYIPENLINSKMCIQAISKYGYLIRYVPKNLITEFLCLKAIKCDDSEIFQYIPDIYKTYRNCFYALTKHDDVHITDIPKIILSKEFIIECLLEEPRLLYDKEIYEYINEHLDEDLYCKLISKHDIYEIIPEKFKTKQICIKAIAEYDIKYNDIPKNILSEQFIKETVLLYSCNKLLDISEEYITEELCIFLTLNNMNFKIPEKFKTFELLFISCSNNINFDITQLETFKNNEKLYMTCINKDINKLELIPERFHTKTLCKFALLVNKNAIKYIKLNFDELFDNINEKEMEDCVICSLNRKYFISYNCGHIICFSCYKTNPNCYYKCTNNISDIQYFKNLNFKSDE